MKIYQAVLLVCALNTLLFAEDAATSESTPATQTQTHKRLWEGHAQYLFAQASITVPDDDSFNWGTDVDEHESMVGIEYYLQLYRQFFMKAGFGKTDYTYTKSYVSTGETIERRDAEFDYIQGGFAFAFYDGRNGLATLDLDYMSPTGGSATKEADSVVTHLDDPAPKLVASLNANYCYEYACLGTGLSTTRYAGILIWHLRIGGKF